MTLAMSTVWPKHMGEWAGKPTGFANKIWTGLLVNSKFTGKYSFEDLNETLDVYFERAGAERTTEVFDTHGDNSIKLHTMREDRHDRWGAECNIHFAINDRSPERFQFAPVLKCTGVQKIEITYADSDGFPWGEPKVHIDGKWCTEIENLAKNDGFESVYQFFAWFNTDFTGKIIHWTDLKY